MDIKSAYELAMEKVDKIGEATEEEKLRWKYGPEGEKLAARFLREDFDIVAEVNKFDAKGAKYVTDTATGIFIRNIALPRTDSIKATNKKAMNGIKALKKDKTKTEAVLSQMRRVFTHFTEQGEQQRKQAFAQVKAAFQMKVEQALAQQGSELPPGAKIDIEKQPQFQEEWRKIQTQLDGQYNKLLDEMKADLKDIP
jgi:hypothetical protein